MVIHRANERRRCFRFFDRVDEVVRTLAEFPEMGRERPHLGEDVRSLKLNDVYGLFYPRTDTAVRLLRVLSYARDIRPALFSQDD